MPITRVVCKQLASTGRIAVDTEPFQYMTALEMSKRERVERSIRNRQLRLVVAFIQLSTGHLPECIMFES